MLNAYVVQITSGGNWSMVHQKLNASMAEAYEHRLDEDDMKAISLLDEIKPEYLVKKFSPVKRIRPTEYFEKHFDERVFQSMIRPFIETRLAEALELIHGKDLFIGEKKNPISQSVFWSDQEATVLFHYRRNEENTHYFATLKHKGQRLNIYQSSVLLTSTPCYVIVHDQIMRVKDVEGSKIAPFFRKRYISIPRDTEENYFKKFGMSIIEKYNVYAVGYEIHTEKHHAQPILLLTKLLNGDFGFILKFRYAENEFYYHNGKRISVTMSKNGNDLHFHRIKRSMQWEQNMAESLTELGLEKGANAEFKLSADTSLEDCINWLDEFNLALDEKNMIVRQELDQKYSLAKAELSISIEEGFDWFDVNAIVQFGQFKVPFNEIIPYLKRAELEFPLPDGSIAILPKEWLSTLSSAIEFSTENNGIRLKKHHMGLLNEFQSIAPKVNGSFNLDSFKGVEAEPMPSGFIGELRDYQKAGYDWFYFLKKNGFGGCLADDMGLGKTVQTLALLQREKELPSNEEKSRTSILVVPTSLTFNWLSESQKFTPQLRVLIHSGNQRIRETSHFKNFDVIITTYGTVRNDIEYLKDYKFNYLILDESQFIKNPRSKMAKAVNELSAFHRLTLTGTPIENSVTDLWSQINFLNKGLLGNQTFFQEHFVNDIEKKRDQSKAERLHAMIKPFVMRRTKQQVAKELPEKTEKIVYCEMTDEQEKIYEEVKSQYRNQILENIQTQGLGKSKLNLLQGLMQLRQIANHPKFVRQDYEGGSGKFEESTVTIPTAIQEGHKILIFSSFVKHLNIFVEHANDSDIPYCYIDGSTPASDRKKQVERFQNDPDIKLFFISLKAGGFGLNLTAADYVFILDPWWNPASELQAIDRTHRIGQKNKVFTYKFITRGTVEEKILALQNSKKSLSDSLIKSEESFVKKLDVNDIKALLS